MPHKKSALVIYDDQTLGAALCETLESVGFETSYCDNGMAALVLAKEKCFDVIVADCRMPGTKGVRTVRALRLQCRDAFIIGLSVDNTCGEFAEAGADAFFKNPFPFDELVSLVSKIAAAP